VLQEKLREFQPTGSDLFMHLDEWNSGTNFNILSEILPRHLGATPFLPIAILSQQSKVSAKHVATHDELVRKLGRGGDAFRNRLPLLTTKARNEMLASPYFWGEKDRLSGFRKMQMHGSIFSTLDEAITSLAHDRTELQKAATFMVGLVAEKSSLPTSAAKAVNIAMKIFEESYPDYQECRDDLRKSGEEEAKGLVFEDLESALSQTISRYGPLVDKRPAKIVLCTASAYLHRLGGLDPENRYLFKHHAPALIQLSGRFGHPHEVALEHIREHLRTLTG
jgi:hypothetical protein